MIMKKGAAKNIAKGAALLAGTLTAAETVGSVYFYRRTMIRGNAKTKRTIRMAGTPRSCGNCRMGGSAGVCLRRAAFSWA